MTDARIERSHGGGKCSDSGWIWKVEPREFSDELDAGLRGKESWRTPRVWPKNLEGWSCHQLRSGLWVEQTVGGGSGVQC